LAEVLGGTETVFVFSFHDDGLREEAVAFDGAGADALAFVAMGPFGCK
jgi:hypothetical protein